MPWDDLSFASKGEVTYGAIRCTNWLNASLYHTGAALYVPTVEVIDAALASELDIYLIGPFSAKDSGINAMRI